MDEHVDPGRDDTTGRDRVVREPAWVTDPDADSFPASDPPDGWAGPDDPRAAGVEDASVPDPIPEADAVGTAEAWERSGAMDGQAPTG